MKHSALLTYIYMKLEAWKTEDRVKELSAGYFLAAALDTLLEDTLPRTVNATELKLAERILSAHSFDRRAVSDRLREAVRSRLHASAVASDEALYATVLRKISAEHGTDGTHVLPDYLGAILDAPSGLINACIEGMISEKPKKPGGSIFDGIGGMKIGDLMGKRPTAEAAEPKRPVAEDESKKPKKTEKTPEEIPEKPEESAKAE